MRNSQQQLQIKKNGYQRGAVAVELAIIIFPLILCVVAVVEFSRVMMTYNQLTKATRVGARHLSFFDPEDTATYPQDDVKQLMLQANIHGLESSHIIICDRENASACTGESFEDVPAGGGLVNLVKVSIQGYVYTPVFPGFNLMSSITLGEISTTMRQPL